MNQNDIESLYRTHGRAILLYLQDMVRDSDAAADLLQEVFVAAMRYSPDGRPAVAVKGWLFWLGR